MVVVMAFVLIDVITLTVVTAVPESRDAPTLIRDKQNPSTNNVCPYIKEYTYVISEYMLGRCIEQFKYMYLGVKPHTAKNID